MGRAASGWEFAKTYWVEIAGGSKVTICPFLLTRYLFRTKKIWGRMLKWKKMSGIHSFCFLHWPYISQMSVCPKTPSWPRVLFFKDHNMVTPVGALSYHLKSWDNNSTGLRLHTSLVSNMILINQKLRLYYSCGAGIRFAVLTLWGYLSFAVSI